MLASLFLNRQHYRTGGNRHQQQTGRNHSRRLTRGGVRLPGGGGSRIRRIAAGITARVGGRIGTGIGRRIRGRIGARVSRRIGGRIGARLSRRLRAGLGRRIRALLRIAKHAQIANDHLSIGLAGGKDLDGGHRQRTIFVIAGLRECAQIQLTLDGVAVTDDIAAALIDIDTIDITGQEDILTLVKGF